MNHASLGISLIALVPAVALCAYVYFKDRMEKEPIWLLAVLLLSGAAVYFPALLLEQTFGGWIDSAFAEKMIFSFDGVLTFTSEGSRISHSAIFAVIIALVEETLKWALLFFITAKSKHFNYLFDGIVYSTFISMGFAAVENIRYAVIDGWDTLFLRAVTSVPGHLFFGIFMGCCFTIWHTYNETKNIEKDMIGSSPLIKPKFRFAPLWLVLSYVMPAAVHAIYIFAGSYDSRPVTIFYCIFVLALYVLCFLNINRMSGDDTSSERLAYTWVIKKHLDLENRIENLTKNLISEEESENE